MTKTNTENLAKMIDLLAPLSSEDRQRLVRASLTFLGEGQLGTGKHGGAEDLGAGEDVPAMPVRARTWLKQAGLTMEQVQQVFHITDGKVEVIAAEIPGSSTKERAVNAYVLAGVANYLASGDLKFDDKTGRSVCSTAGCFDSTNHATYLKAKGNLFSGSKETGWALTTPGLKHGADLVRTLTRSQ